MNSKGLILIICGALSECVWAYGLKHSTNGIEWAGTLFFIVASFLLFTRSLKFIDTSIAYVLFTGLGSLFVVLLEMANLLTHGGQIDFLRIFFVATLIFGVITIKSAKQ